MERENERLAAGKQEHVRERKRQYKRKAGRKKLFRFLCVVVCVAACSLFIVITVFKLKKVEVSGNKIYTKDKMKDWIINDEYSDNSLYVYLKYQFFEPDELPFVDTMEVELIPPSTIKINVIEKAILGYLYLDQLGQNVYFDREGFVIEISPEAMEDVPRITGIEVDKIVLYEKLPIKKENGVLKDLLSLTKSLKKYEVVPERIHYTAGSGYEMFYDKLRVKLGQALLVNDKMIRLAEILPMLKGQSGILHLENMNEHLKDITFEKNVDK